MSKKRGFLRNTIRDIMKDGKERKRFEIIIILQTQYNLVCNQDYSSYGLTKTLSRMISNGELERTAHGHYCIFQNQFKSLIISTEASFNTEYAKFHSKFDQFSNVDLAELNTDEIKDLTKLIRIKNAYEDLKNIMDMHI